MASEITPASTTRPRPRSTEFDPYLGAVCAPTWWDLGRLIAHRSDSAWIEKRLKTWRDDPDPVSAEHISAQSVKQFAADVLALLHRKYNRESIAADAKAIWDISAAGTLRDDGQYIEYDETFEVFWATEKRFVLEELDRPAEANDIGWLNAVDVCRECNTFFVKQRIDQIFDSARCRTTFSNRDAYLRRRNVGRRRH